MNNDMELWMDQSWMSIVPFTESESMEITWKSVSSDGHEIFDTMMRTVSGVSNLTLKESMVTWDNSVWNSVSLDPISDSMMRTAHWSSITTYWSAKTNTK